MDQSELEALRDSARDVLEDRLALDKLRKFVNGGEKIDAALWRTAGELGWLGLALPENHGGSGLGFSALAVLYQEMGRFLAPLPFLPTVLCGEALAAAGSDAQRKQWLPVIAEGGCIG